MLDDRQNLSRSHAYQDIISVENLLVAWQEFIAGKRRKIDVNKFQARFMDNILVLHQNLKDLSYQHSAYQAFKVNDPKPRDIHKAEVRDRLLHHAIYRKLYPFFDRKWISDSFSCRDNKGTHKAIERFKAFFYKVSKNNTRTCWVLKCDIKKFFASIDHQILMSILSKQLVDANTLNLIQNIIENFSSTAPGKGLPLGNLTSQLLVNVYMNEFDQFMKHKLKAKYYIRYADDFVVLSENRQELEILLLKIKQFLIEHLSLTMHPTKISISTFASGVDFLGWVHFPKHRMLRTSTKRRMIRNLANTRSKPVIQSYRGLLCHGDTHRLSTKHLQ